MSDLFATPAHIATEPPMARTPTADADSYDLYTRDRPRWLADAAPRCARRILQGNDETIRIAWPSMAADYKTAVWLLLDRTGRMTVRAALDGAAAPTDLTQVPA